MIFNIPRLLGLIASAMTILAASSSLGSPKSEIQGKPIPSKTRPATHISDGIRLGIGIASPFTIRNEAVDYSITTEKFTGLELAWTSIPKVGQSITGRSIGYFMKLNFYSATTIHQDVHRQNNRVSISELAGSVTYTFYDRLYGFAGLHLPLFSFQEPEEDIFFEGNISPILGAGYQFAQSWTVEGTLSENKYDILHGEKPLDKKIGQLRHPMSQLTVNYSF